MKQAVDAYIAVELAPQTMGGIAPDYDPNQYRQRFRSQPTIRLPSKGAPPPGKPPSKGVVKSKTTELAAKATPTEYDGPVRFNNFYSTLQTIGYLGTYPKNQFILFYAENSRAASRLLGLACQFAIQGKTVVHFGIAGRNDDDPAQLIAANQLSADPKCELTIHDARSERAMDSTPSRNGIAIRAALGYFNRFMHPQAVIVDPENETSEFLESVRHKNQLLGQTTVELPRDAVQKLPWFQFLDSGSLQCEDCQSLHVDIELMKCSLEQCEGRNTYPSGLAQWQPDKTLEVFEECRLSRESTDSHYCPDSHNPSAQLYDPRVHSRL